LAATSDYAETLQNEWQCAKEILKTEELNKLVLVTDNQGKKAWLLTANSDNS
jgi:hypothetical protein